MHQVTRQLPAAFVKLELHRWGRAAGASRPGNAATWTCPSIGAGPAREIIRADLPAEASTN